ncbi:Auxin-induced protein 5NG4 [Triticum urartu]|uniref:WAT1-related protein n=2 Tax=Triticum TaxID=4564 RepID=A0A9R0SM84_TRITD|nr:Auxin-induced protein 5NG4 [Triticum urartu]VAH97764.1 unnamed protein product [Triticum turgidum subsp. durum]
MGLGGLWRRYAPHNMMIMVQLCYTLMYFVTEAAFNRGLNPYVYVTYRHLLVALLLWPFAYYHEKKLRPKMTWMLFLEIFVLSLLGFHPEKNKWNCCRVSLTLNMYFASLKYTSPTFVTSMVNTVASITFVIAIALRMEIVDLRSARGLAKVAGTAVSFAGVTTMTLYKGAAIASPWRAPGLACSGFTVFAQLWCTEKKGPVFVTMFNPVSTIMVAILAYFIFGENLYVGSIIGGVVVILGLYMLLWGKDKDQEYNNAGAAASGEEQAGEPGLDCEKQRQEEQEETKTMK